MKAVYYPAKERGSAEHGWLHARFSFSFDQFYDSKRMGFGALRVLNNDIIEPSSGFAMHHHADMEIITIPLKGTLTHKDSLGTGSSIGKSEVQVMSAGTGIHHSEFNPSTEEQTELLQIWLLPERKNIAPRYDQMRYTLKEHAFTTIVAGKHTKGCMLINQDAKLSLGRFEKGTTISYPVSSVERGVYCFLIEGSVRIGAHILGPRDALAITRASVFDAHALQSSLLLAIEVPMDTAR